MGKKKFWGLPSNSKELIDGCKAYLKKNPRDVAYKEAVKLAKRGEELDGILLLLTSWNSAYSRPRRIYPNQIIEEASHLLQNTSQERLVLRNKKLETINSGDLERIESMFRTFWQEKAIGCTGASKALHILEPQLFVPWDTAIRQNYHSKHQNSSHSYEKCYLAFMKQMCDCARRLIERKPKEQICKECSNNEFLTVDLPKALDQYNFATAKGLL